MHEFVQRELRQRVSLPSRTKALRARALLATAAAGALYLILAAPAHADGRSSEPVAPKWQPWTELGGYYGSDDSSRGEGVLWMPLIQGPTALFFTDMRFKLFEEDVHEGNFALGHRRMTSSGWNLGAWGGLDVRNTDTGNTFWQVSGGLEALSANWDLRVNGYAPISDPEGSPSLAEVQLSGNNIFMIGGEEVPLYGVDGEVGYRLFASPETAAGHRHEIRVYGGGFWFDDSDALDEVAGPKARAEWRIDDIIAALPGSRLTLEGEFSHDDVRDDKWEIGARLRIPFGGKGARYAALTAQERRMAEGLERDTDIITAQSKEEPVEDALTNVDFDRVAYVNDGGSVTNTSNNAGGNTLIIANGTIGGPQDLQGNQTLQGGGSTIRVRGLKSGTVAGFTAPGTTPVLNFPGMAPNLTLLGDRTHVAGLDIQGSGALGNQGIFGGSGRNTILIDQTRIASTEGGIFFTDFNSNVTIANTEIIDVTRSGIYFTDFNNNVTIADATVTNTGTDGIYFAGFNNNVTIAGTTIANAGSAGIELIEFNTGVTISGTTITDAVGDGIAIGEAVLGMGNIVTLQNSTLAGNFGDDGIDINQTGNIVAGAGNTAAGATFGSQFCEVTGAQTGQFTFDIGNCPP